MIRMRPSQTAERAKSYFDESLSKADYYINDQELNGRFHGKLAERLGLRNDIVERDVFHKLCDNINPNTGENLTPRTVENRRVGYDISFHCPKSVSILHALSDDDKILDAFKEAVHETMLEMETEMQTRVRISGQNHDRDTGELLWADFVHQTARPVDGHPPDPHLHCHCYTFNATWDEQEQRVKAGQFHDIYKDQPWYEARFHKRLADKISELGYEIRKTDRNFEVAMIPQRAIDHFSKRTNEIGQVAEERGITDPKELDQLGARTRSKKQSSMSMNELQSAWKKQLKLEGIDERTKGEERTLLRSSNPKESINHALEHAFATRSVEYERKVVAQSYLHAIDTATITLDQLDMAFKNDERIHFVPDGKETLCTTIPIQQEERRMVQLAKAMRSNSVPLVYSDDPEKIEHLNEEQQVAVRHMLKSNDQLLMVRGGAGTGKTTMMKTAVEHIESTGKCVYAFAPTADASRGVLREEGFETAETVARLLSDQDMQANIAGQVMWVDEAGMLSTKEMADILELGKQLNAKVLLTGDTQQHTSVQRGDAMRILQRVAGIPIPSTNRIYRQKSKEYREAVEAINDGHIASGFEKLDSMGAIEEVESDEVVDRIAEDYIKAIQKKRSTLVISPTNMQAQAVTDRIREALKQESVIGKNERTVLRYKNLHFSDAKKKDWRNYKKGQVIQLHQNMKGLKRGACLTVESSNNGTVSVHHNGQSYKLDLKQVKRFGVYQSLDMKLSKGDTIRITKNSFDLNKKRLDNGKVFDVVGFDPSGVIKLRASGKKRGVVYEVSSKHGNINHAYCMTSYASQGKTYNQVLIAQPATTFPASDMKQFYVSVSRGREAVKIYTDDKDHLLQTVQDAGDRMSVHELDALERVQSRRMNTDRTQHFTQNKDDYEPDI